MLPLSLVIVGLSLLAYAAYSIITCMSRAETVWIVPNVSHLTDRDVLKLSQQELDHVPKDAQLLIAIGTIVASLGTFSRTRRQTSTTHTGAVQLAGKLKPIHPAAASKGVVNHHFRPDFMTFNHRGGLVPMPSS